ncbi:MAG: YHS domain-containing (seleno)protein [Pseudomonadota bacterium]
MLKRLFLSLALVVAAFGATPASATNQLATAIGGYDAVAYFTAGEPRQGKARYHHFWNGAVWFFESGENRDTFAADPVAYAPQYDGYCAWAASQNYKRPGDPNVWQVEGGKLYLKVHEGAQEKWRADIPTHIAQGDENWIQIAPY